MPVKPTAITKQIPILRFLLALSVGIIVQYNTSIRISVFWGITIIGVAFSFLFLLLPFAKQFTLSYLQGLSIMLCFVGFGALVSFYNNDVNYENSFVNTYKKEALYVELLEDVANKPKSYKANAKVLAKYSNNKWVSTAGKIIVYTQKDSVFATLKMGNAFVFSKSLTRIVNSGNPGGYNYERFCSFQDIYHQVYLLPKDVEQITKLPVNKFKGFIYNIQHWVLDNLKKYIKDNNALSIAEALLIGYREDLDKDLVKAYSNTGVVHIIAISGMHLGMIYWMLLLCFRSLKQTTTLKIVRAITVIIILWLFSAVAGLAPSIVRSAIMFSVIAIGESFNKKSGIYNSLALSAFIILLFQPFALWDVGFQLSYAAVLSIALFSASIKKWYYVKNKLLQAFFNLNAITISAQVLTLPIVLYHFHQFPTYFLLTNLIAVPISSIILFAEIGLLIIAFITPFANWLGNCINSIIIWLNNFILNTNNLPFASIGNIYISITQASILMVAIAIISAAILNSSKKQLLVGFGVFAFFMGFRMVDVIQKQHQQKIVIYNVPLYTGIDFIDGNNYSFWGDSILQKEGFLQNFHIKPSRIFHRLQNEVLVNNLVYNNNIFKYKSTSILVIDNSFKPIESPISVDVVLVTQNPKLYINQLKNITTKMIVFDGSNPMWKIELWQKDCVNLHLPHHITALQGAYIVNL